MEGINKVGIVGVGLLGGSIGLAVKQRYPHISVIGIGRNEGKLKRAVEIKALDSYSLDFSGIQDCDIIILCTPIRTIGQMYGKIAPYLKETSIVTDVGSTKKAILEEINNNFTDSNHFVGSHPMAGSEQTGVEYANSDLYEGATVVITESKNKENNKKVDTFWQKLGANTIVLTADAHDRLVANTSHLPHIVASCLSYNLDSTLSETDKMSRVFGNGLLDTTRISEGDPQIWLDIFMTNQDNVLASIRDFKEKLELIENIIDQSNEHQLCDYLEKGRIFRRTLLNHNNQK